MAHKGKAELIDAALFAMGYLMAKEGVAALPVVILAKALDAAGCDAIYVQAVVETANQKEPKS